MPPAKAFDKWTVRKGIAPRGKDDFDENNPIGSIGALVSQFAPMLPKNIQPLLQDPSTMKYIEKLVKDNPDKVNELIQKFVKSPKKNDKVPDNDLMSI